MTDKKVAILVGGGPAPGINSVIGAATIRVSLAGAKVVGVRDGFRWIMEGDTEHIQPLTIESVSRIHFRGGSILGIARANPTKDEQKLENTVVALQKLGVEGLITIGGDDTAFSAYKLAKKAAGRLRVVHVPKTIDNDLDLPQDVYTFGFQTARHVGVDIVKNLMVDAYTTSRWYFVVAMGRKAGHLAMGIGKAAGATLTLIPEEFPEKKLRLAKLVDLLAVAILKRLSYGRVDGVAVMAEGLVEKIDEQDLEELQGIERDDHGHIRIAEIDFGDIIKRHVVKRLAEFKVKATVIAKNIGYEVRCADPIPYDLEYTRDLGYCAAKYLIEGGNGAVVTIQGGHFRGVPFEEMMDPVTGRTRVRMVDIESTRYRIARRYMIRLRRDDFESAEELAKLAATAKMTPEQFRETFEYVIADEPPRIRLHPEEM